MDLANLWVIELVGPAILLIVMIWLAVRSSPNRDDRP